MWHFELKPAHPQTHLESCTLMPRFTCCRNRTSIDGADANSEPGVDGLARVPHESKYIQHVAVVIEVANGPL